MNGWWQKAMMGWAGFVVMFGAVLCGGAFAGLDGPALALMERMGGAVLLMSPALRFSIGLMGAVTLGWGLTVLAVASVSHLLEAEAARALWRRIVAALIVWYLIDGTISIATGFGLNALSNTLLLVAFLFIAWRAGVLTTPATASGKAGDVAASHPAR